MEIALPLLCHVPLEHLDIVIDMTGITGRQCSQLDVVVRTNTDVLLITLED